MNGDVIRKMKKKRQNKGKERQKKSEFGRQRPTNSEM